MRKGKFSAAGKDKTSSSPKDTLPFSAGLFSFKGQLKFHLGEWLKWHEGLSSNKSTAKKKKKKH
jgi:hypothetical protein